MRAVRLRARSAARRMTAPPSEDMRPPSKLATTLRRPLSGSSIVVQCVGMRRGLREARNCLKTNSLPRLDASCPAPVVRYPG